MYCILLICIVYISFALYIFHLYCINFICIVLISFVLYIFFICIVSSWSFILVCYEGLHLFKTFSNTFGNTKIVLFGNINVAMNFFSNCVFEKQDYIFFCIYIQFIWISINLQSIGIWLHIKSIGDEYHNTFSKFTWFKIQFTVDCFQTWQT